VPAPLTLPDRAHRLAAHRLPVTAARFVDAQRAASLEKLHVRTIGDLVRHYPFRYLDLSAVETLRDVKPGREVTVVGTVHEIRVKKPRPRLTITEVAIVDGTGVLIGVWFNQPWVQQRFLQGERVAFAGKVELDYGFKQIKTPFATCLPRFGPHAGSCHSQGHFTTSTSRRPCSALMTHAPVWPTTSCSCSSCTWRCVVTRSLASRRDLRTPWTVRRWLR